MTKLEDALNNAFEEYKTIRAEAKEHRKSFIDSLAETLEKRGKGKKAKIVRQLIDIEEKRALFRKLSYINGKSKDLGTSYVTVKNGDGEREITDRKEMEETITKINRIKYHQTEQTCPFMTSPLYEDFGPLGNGKKSSLVIEGDYVPSPMLAQCTKDFIEACSILPSTPTTDLPRTLEEYKMSWRKMKERTSSNSLHFGHYKAATFDEKHLALNYVMAEIPFRSGYSPTRWHSATNVMILKAEGNTDIDSLRTLALFESDFNHNNKYLGREMMKHCTEYNLLAPEQYSVPGRKCIDHVLNRRLLFDITRYQKTSLALSSVD